MKIHSEHKRAKHLEDSLKLAEGSFKKNLRNILLKKRGSIKSKERKIRETAIKKRLLALIDFKKAKSILFYASFRSEVNTISCIQHAIKLRKKIALPLVDEKKRELRLYNIKDISELISGYMGILEPKIKRGREMSLKNIDIAIIPGIGFDMVGNRLGYGAGYYDKLLGNKSQRLSKSKKHITTIALAFEKQIIPKVPNERHDVKIDKIITEKRAIICKN